MGIADLQDMTSLMKPRWSDDSDDNENRRKPGRTPTVLSDAFKNAKGQLHEDLGVSKGKKIAKSKMIAASQGKYGKKAKKRAIPALNMARARGD